VVATVRADSLEAALHTVLSLGAEVEVVAPAALRDRVPREALALARLHRGQPSGG
jgi:predicted DNA-binding transcriptional regulator YafY